MKTETIKVYGKDAVKLYNKHTHNHIGKMMNHSKVISNDGSLMSNDEAEFVAEVNTRDEDDGWTYEVIPNYRNSGLSVVAVYNESHTFMGLL